MRENPVQAVPATQNRQEFLVAIPADGSNGEDKNEAKEGVQAGTRLCQGEGADLFKRDRWHRLLVVSISTQNRSIF